MFCRVRPVLSSDLPPDGFFRLASSADGLNGEYPNTKSEAEDRFESLKAEISFPDKLDPKEIILRSSSESATGQERKDEWAFTFDRV